MLEDPSVGLKAFHTVMFVIPFERCRLFKFVITLVSRNLAKLIGHSSVYK